MNKKRQVIRYLALDFMAAAISWTIFFIYRKVVIEPKRFGIEIPVEFTNNYYLGLLFIPLLWITFYYVTGFYENIYRRSRLIELWQTFITSLTGVIFIFFVFILDDYVDSYVSYYQLFFTLFGLHFGLTYFFRLLLTSRTIHRIHKREIGFNTIIIGSNEKAENLFKEMITQKSPAGHMFTGFVGVENNDDKILGKYMPNLGNLNNINKIIQQNNIEEVIIAIETREQEKLNALLTVLENQKVTIWGIPDLYDFLSGTVKTTEIFGIPLIKISNGLMPTWQANMKRLMDVVLSIIAIILFLPLFIVLSILIKKSSKGPVIYKQERIGRFGKPFYIYKLRSMVEGAENGTPALSSENDERITKIGRILRKTHLDEIPQFYNVIKGDMSLVGPRPERKYFIDQIVKKAPHYTHLHKIRPGITSWGQVKYGYASNLDEMLERLPYDMMYLKNLSIYVDIKILIHTILVSLKANGK
ncbi:MAG TPA: sugar transferase [Mariniphaga sp.]|nr:sugar transferase [Mariniphaga sp.]